MTDKLAILGGTPVRPAGPPDWPGVDPDVTAAVTAALADGSWGRYDGPHIPELERTLSAFHAGAAVTCCASGTLAVEIALRSLDVSAGSEVILAAYDYEPNFLNCLKLGALPVLVDVRPDNKHIALDALESAIGPATKAIVVSHLHGGLAAMGRIRSMADQAGVPVIEDTAQAVGATVQGRRAGTWGDIGVLSFGGSKLLSAGRGGALIATRPEWHQRIRLELRRAVQQWAAMSELQAAALIPQLSKLDDRHARRAEAVRILDEGIVDIPGLTRFRNSVDGSPAYYKVGYHFDPAAFGLDRATFTAAVRAEGVAIDPGFRALHVGRSAKRFRAAGTLAEAERAHECVVMLHHPVLLGNANDLAEVARAIRKVYANAQLLR